MITYNDIYEAKKNPLFLFESPRSAERWYLLVQSDRYHKTSEGNQWFPLTHLPSKHGLTISLIASEGNRIEASTKFLRNLI